MRRGQAKPNHQPENPMFQRLTTVLFASMIGALILAVRPAHAETVLRVGHFPNITHIQGLVAHALSRQGKGFLERRLGSNVKIEWFVYNAGPSAIEAIFAKSIDFTYVGPNPAINAYVKARGEGVRIIAGAAEGGSALVIQGEFDLDDRRRFSRQDYRDAATRQHPRCRRPRLVEGRRAEDYPGWR
jgi:ABC-type nitrate/sulfonate/bicarbonate transport system substrate-binding protein